MRSTDNPQSPQPESVSALSITHILASALAAVTATFAASYFGVSGTIIGAALASVVTVVGNTLYSHSIQRTYTGHPAANFRPAVAAANTYDNT